MDPSSAHHREMSNETLETILVSSKSSNNNNHHDQQQQKKPRPQPEEALKCPRCESTNTKFCYYNNYSLSQPRYLCKSCRRYWTKGGTLRNVPVGGGCRKNKKSSASSSSSSSSSFKSKSTFHDEHQPLNDPLITGLPSFGNSYEAVDLNLAFARLQKQSPSSGGAQLGLGFSNNNLSIFGNSTNAHSDIFGNSSNTVDNGAGGGLFRTDQSGNFSNLSYGFMMGADDDEHHHQHNKSSNVSSTATVLPSDYQENIKQELCINGGSNSENPNKVLWGFPWQTNAESETGGPEMDSGRECWNGFASSWHGLLNSTLT